MSRSNALLGSCTLSLARAVGSGGRPCAVEATLLRHSEISGHLSAKMTVLWDDQSLGSLLDTLAKDTPAGRRVVPKALVVGSSDGGAAGGGADRNDGGGEGDDDGGRGHRASTFRDLTDSYRRLHGEKIDDMDDDDHVGGSGVRDPAHVVIATEGGRQTSTAT